MAFVVLTILIILAIKFFRQTTAICSKTVNRITNLRKNKRLSRIEFDIQSEQIKMIDTEISKLDERLDSINLITINNNKQLKVIDTAVDLCSPTTSDSIQETPNIKVIRNIKKHKS